MVRQAAPVVLALLTLAAAGCNAPEPGRPTWGAEVRAYPAGIVPGVEGRVALDDDETVFLRAGWNVTDRGDWGEHDDESGGGPGFGFGWRKHEGAPDGSGPFYGLAMDFWFLDVDWRDGPAAAPTATGNSDLLVWQPTGEVGWAWRIGRTWMLEGTFAVGAEVDVVTNGESVGQGPIVLVGLRVVHVPPPSAWRRGAVTD